MALQRSAVTFNFAGGLDLKTDPNQLQIGKFVELNNSIFDKLGRLTKRNGFKYLPALPDSTSSFLATFNGGLTAIGKDLKSLSIGARIWTNRGSITPMSLSVMPLARSSTNITQVDATVSNNGLILATYAEAQPLNQAPPSYKYTIIDQETGQTVINPTLITPSFGTLSYPFGPRVFSLANNFVIMFGSNSGSTSHLQYITVNTRNTNTVSSATDFSTSYFASATSSTSTFDGVVANDVLYMSWNGAGQTGIKSSYLDKYLTQSPQVVIASVSASLITVASDVTQSTPVIWTTGYLAGSNSGVIVATNQNLSTLFSAVQYVNSSTAKSLNIASSAQNGVMTLLSEINNSYSYGSGGATNYINSLNAFQTGSLSASSTLIRSLGLASKAFIVNSTSYFLGSYSSPLQPTYFLINSTGANVAKLAYSNGSGYITSILPSVSVSSTSASIGYLIKDTIASANKNTAVSSTTQTAQIYSSTGPNLATFDFSSETLVTSEIGSNLNLSGGMLQAFDGQRLTEQGFHLFPDPVVAVNGSGGALVSQTYFYQAIYSWRDAQGNIFRSAPSVPYQVSGGGNNVINIPTLRVTNKPSGSINAVVISLYRWSTAQQSYYQVTSSGIVGANSLTSDSIAVTDTASDASILGNELLYTTGGVLENIGAPANNSLTVFDSRLWLIDAEDPNLLWYSKQVIEGTPVEMTDLLTFFVSPNAGAQGSTGPCKCLFPMDDKLIASKKNALYYINGTGPDNTGANSQYSPPIFVTSVVGSDNQNSFVMTPNGIMFQSDKGIWLLGRDLSTQYIGKDVEAFNNDRVLSALAIPATNQVRFTLESGTTLMYDYFVGQWGIFSGLNGISSVLYEKLHSFIDAEGNVFQESVGSYLDGTNPVLMSWKTGQINPTGLEGYQRLYRMYLLGEFITPHILTMGVAYDYDDNVSQLVTIVPENYTGTWGSSSTWGSVSRWGGSQSREQWEIGFIQQQCQSFQLSFNEYYDSSFGIAAGAGLTLSGIKIIAGVKGTEANNIPAKNKTS